MKNINNKNFLKKKIKKKIFTNFTFNYCDFWEAEFDKVIFENSVFNNCIFCDAKFKEVKFVNCIFKNSNFSHTHFYKSSIVKTSIINVNFRDSVKDNYSDIDNKIPITRTINLKIKKSKSLSVVEKKILKSLTTGKGYYVLKNFFSKEKIIKASKIIDNILIKQIKFNKLKKNFARDKKLNQKYVYNLLNKHKIFSQLIQPKPAMKVFDNLLGKDFVCGFFGANCLLPGARGQFPHLDYPYLSFMKPGDLVPFQNKFFKFYLNCQILIPLTQFNLKNGSTAILENSHKLNKFPKKKDIFKYKYKRLNLDIGSIVIFNGTLWHYACSNYSKNLNRYCTLAQYLPKFIVPMLDMKSKTKKSVYSNDIRLKKLLGINLDYPSIRN